MKKIALIAAVALVVPAWAQQATPPAEPAKPAAEEATKAAEAPKPKPAQRKIQAHPSKRQEDARHCLEKGSNTEIIKCAEAYL